jgi:hypothetical protein
MEKSPAKKFIPIKIGNNIDGRWSKEITIGESHKIISVAINPKIKRFLRR